MHEPQFNAYAAHTQRLLEKFMPTALVDIWDWNPPWAKPHVYNAERLQNYTNLAPDVKAFTQQSISINATNACLDNGTPVNFAAADLWYPSLNASAPLHDLVSRITTAAYDCPRPCFIVVYGLLNGASGPGIWNISDFALGATSLLSAEFQIVGAGDLAGLSRQACAQDHHNLG